MEKSRQIISQSLEDNALTGETCYSSVIKPLDLGDIEEASDVIQPHPGKCLKTKDENGKKIFINICTSDKLPSPSVVSDEELVNILQSEDPSAYRVPISIGESHDEVDKSRSECTAYDVVIHPNCFSRSETFQQFLYIVSLEGVENKYELKLNRDFVMLKNKKCMGDPVEQRVRRKAKPWIADISSGSTTSRSTKMPLIEESKGVKPRYSLSKKLVSGTPVHVTCIIDLPNLTSSATINLEVGEDRILMLVSPARYHLDLYLPLNVMSDQTTAFFNRQTKKLEITMPVVTPP